MPYFLRVLSPSCGAIAASALRTGLRSAGLHAQVTGDEGEGDWDELSVSRPNGQELLLIGRAEVTTKGLGKDEIEEFLAEVDGALPRSAANWLKVYLPSVRTIYALEVLGAVQVADDWSVVGCIKETIWRLAGGIIQADLEGFSNEDGYHILWRFSDDVTGSWWMAVLDNGSWRTFEMDLGNTAHREAFMRGEAPAGCSSAI